MNSAAAQSAPRAGAGPLAARRIPSLPAGVWNLAAILMIALGLRIYALGRLSFWYDEVVTMRLARAGGPGALLERLFQIDATRAPLHPLLLSGWIRLFGSSEAAARSFSVLCGIATILIVYILARSIFDHATGLWAAWLTALSPALVVYDREARMYAWLVMLTCLCWDLMFSLRTGWHTAKAVLYVISMTALAYSHPLGVLMFALLAVAGLFDLVGDLSAGGRWLAVYGTAALLVLPWLPNYLDHPAEFLSGRLPLRFLLGTPIGFVGGNFLVLLGLALVIVFGIARWGVVTGAGRRWQFDRDRLIAFGLLLLWLLVPPAVLYAYSWVGQPIFGPARYTVFVAPAFLILVAAGLRRLPAVARYPLGLALALVSLAALRTAAYDPELKADWRSFARDLAREMAGVPEARVVVVVASADPIRNVEIETARYYLPAGTVAIADEETTGLPDLSGARAIYYAVGCNSRSSLPANSAPKAHGFYQYKFREFRHYPGLTVMEGFWVRRWIWRVPAP
jgi:mannosyltransferase